MTMAQSKSGFLWLTDHADSKHKLMAVAYTGVSDPFVVFYNGPMGIWTKPCAVVRLRDCVVKEMDDLTFVVTPLGERIGSGPGFLLFAAENHKEKDSWIGIFKNFGKERESNFDMKERSLRRRNSRCAPKLPAIEETEEREQRQRRRSLSLVTA